MLEARDRAGGRVFTGSTPDGAWFGSGQDGIQWPADEMGVGSYPTYEGAIRSGQRVAQEGVQAG